MEIPILSILAFTAFGLLLAVTVGITYLTAAEWRDRRRQTSERRATKRKR